MSRDNFVPAFKIIDICDNYDYTKSHIQNITTKLALVGLQYMITVPIEFSYDEWYKFNDFIDKQGIVFDEWTATVLTTSKVMILAFKNENDMIQARLLM